MKRKFRKHSFLMISSSVLYLIKLQHEFQEFCQIWFKVRLQGICWLVLITKLIKLRNGHQISNTYFLIFLQFIYQESCNCQKESSCIEKNCIAYKSVERRDLFSTVQVGLSLSSGSYSISVHSSQVVLDNMESILWFWHIHNLSI